MPFEKANKQTNNANENVKKFSIFQIKSSLKSSYTNKLKKERKAIPPKKLN